MAETATAPTETLKISDPSSVQHVKRRNFVFPGCLAARRGKDGTTMQIARLPDIDDNTWAEVKAYVEGPPRNASVTRSRRAHSSMAFGRRSLCSCSFAHPGNPETAKALQSFAKNPEAMRGTNLSIRHCYNMLQQFLMLSMSFQAGCRLRPSPSFSA